MPEVKAKAALPPNERVNGLIAISRDLVAGPRTRRYAVVQFDVAETKVVHARDEETGETWDEHVPYIQVRQVEPLDGDGEDTARDLMVSARAQRDARNAQMRLWAADGGGK